MNAHDGSTSRAPLAPITPADLTTIRARLGLTQQQLAERLGVSTHTVARWSMPSNQGRWPVPHWARRELARMLKDHAAPGGLDRGDGGA